MKKAIAIIVFGLLWCNVGFSKEVSGTQLLCKDQLNKNDPVGFWFLSEVLALRYNIYSWEVKTYEETFTAKPDEIIFKHGSRINRETLKYQTGGNFYNCSIVKDFNFEEYFNKLLKDQIAEQEKKNKL